MAIFGHFFSRQSTLCGYSKVVSGDVWHYEKQIRPFQSHNYEKTMKIWSKYWWFHIFLLFLKNGQLDWTDSCCMYSDILWEGYKVHARHTLKKLWNGHFWPNRSFFGHLKSHFSKNIIYHQSPLCGYSSVVAGDAWHHAKQIYLFGFPNFDKTMKIRWNKSGFQIF